MSTRTISMAAPMFLAILGGTKTQTRRIIKPQPEPFVQCTPDRHPQKHPAPYIDAYCSVRKTTANPRGMSDGWCWWTRDDRQGSMIGKCPYGVPGDILTVRGTNVDLGIVSIRVELLNDISEEDAQAEGVTAHDMYGADGLAFADGCTNKATFSNLWKSIYGTGAWAENPYVWVVEFKRVKP